MLKENYKEIETLKVIYEANDLGVWLWLEGDILKFKAPENTNTADLFEKLKMQKSEIIQILRYNNIFSQQSSETFIYKLIGKYSPLSFAQERLWFAEQYEQGTSTYHIPLIYQLAVDTDLQGIKYALHKIVARHHILRTTIEQDDISGQTVQRVHDEPIEIDDITISDVENYHELMRKYIIEPFNLSLEYPIRIRFYKVQSSNTQTKLSEDKILLVINLHHIASDGWSSDVFENELFAYYGAYTQNNKTFDLPALEIQYRDYALWQKIHLTQDILKKQLDYWKQKLNRYTILEFPTDFSRPAKVDFNGSSVLFRLNKQVSQQLKSLAKQYGVTMHCVMLSGLHILLNKYTGQDDIITGSPNANRHNRQTESLIGFFINTQVNRTTLNASQSFEELIKQVYQDQTEAQLYQDLPFEKLVKEMGGERDPSKHPIFQLIFEVENYSNMNIVSSQQENYLKDYGVEGTENIEKFDLSIFIDISREEIFGDIGYATSLFAKDSLIRFSDHYKNLLAQLVKAPQKPYSEINLFSAQDTVESYPAAKEYQQLLIDFNAISSNYDNVADSVIDLFKRQVEKNPQASALIYEGHSTSYLELNEQSDKLAHYLKANYEIRKNELIAILQDRSDKMLISILAILKVGAAYVPIDPAFPNDRRTSILNDADVRLLLTQTDYMFDLDNYHGSVFAVDVQLDAIGSTLFLIAPTPASDLAYVIYTSGSTGKPKGCAVRHSNLSHYIKWANAYYFESTDTGNFGLYTSLSFDLTVTSIFCTLTRGKCLTIFSQNLEPSAIFEHSFDSKSIIDSIKLTPSHIKLLKQLNLTSSKIKLAIIGGEAVNEDDVSILKQINPDMRVFNEYGPTETTVGCIVQELELNKPVLIGKPIYGTQIYILGASMNLLPLGAIGEICIGGLGLCSGYLNKEELTREKFIPNPFVEGKLMYRTGDLGRWLSDGRLDYKGRNDEQVKIRGYRIELGEIEHALLQVKGIKQVCVVAKDRKTDIDTVSYLLAYYILEDSRNIIDHTVIRDSLSKLLPEYMVPGILMKLEEFPLTINGKIDKRSLPDADTAILSETYVAPTSAIEIAMCKAWEEVLGLECVGITDSFFSIGGDSIISIRLVSKIKQLGFAISVKDIFEYRNIQELLKHIDKQDFDDGIDYIPFSLINDELKSGILNENNLSLEHVQDIYPASYIQAGMLIESFAENLTYRNVDSFTINKEFDQKNFEKIWSELIEKHDQLRTAYVSSEIGYLNVVFNSVAFKSKIIVINNRFDELEEVVNEEKRIVFDFKTPGIYRFLILRSSTNKAFKLLFSHHHVIGDGWSVAALISEFLNAYVNAGFINEGIQPLYGKFVRKELEAIENNTFKQFWHTYFEGYELKSNNFLTKNIKLLSNDLITVTRKIDQELSAQILNFSKELDITPDIFFLGIYNLMLSLFYNTNDLAIGVVVNSRLEEEGGDRAFGLFLNTVPMRFKEDFNKLKDAKSYFLAVLENKLTISRYKSLPYGKVKSDLGFNDDIYQCAFNYVHFHIEEKDHTEKTISTEYSVGKSNIPLIVDFSRFQDSFSFFFEGHSDFIDLETIKRMSNFILYYLKQIVKNPNNSLTDYRFLPSLEHNKVINYFNATEKKYPEKTIHALFEEQVLKHAEDIALVYQQQQFTYAELNERSNQLAFYIKKEYENRTQQPFTSDTLVALCLERSPEVLIGILAVLKAGGAYVPIDPNYPKNRIEYILADSQTAIILSQRNISNSADVKLPLNKVINIDLIETIYEGTIKTNPPILNKINDLAYVIYTSGTTGKPKGVMVEHRSVVNYINNIQEILLTDINRVDFSTNIAFDLTVTTTIAALILGKQIFIYSGDLSDTETYSKHLVNNKIDFLKGTPSLLANLVLDHFVDHKIKQAFIGGEKLEDYQLELISKYVDNPIDEYGPTETTVGATYCNKTLANNHNGIGKPYFNYKIYILSAYNTPLPIGVIGELYIGGAGIARGYLNQPDLNAERFIDNPFVSLSDKLNGDTRLYKTGDLARWLPDGNIEYVGRNDDQVKILGYRIELSEIENALIEIKGIKKAHVIAKERETDAGIVKYLIGYYTPSDNHLKLDEASILKELSESLPSYMIPALLVAMENFPLTVNGKLDKNALKDPGFSSVVENYVAPTSEEEIAVSSIWQKILGLEKVGITDDFFRIGGNSILAIKLSHQMSQALKCDVKVADIFRYRTIHHLHENLSVKSVNVANVSWELSI